MGCVGFFWSWRSGRWWVRALHTVLNSVNMFTLTHCLHMPIISVHTHNPKYRSRICKDMSFVVIFFAGSPGAEEDWPAIETSSKSDNLCTVLKAESLLLDCSVKLHDLQVVDFPMRFFHLWVFCQLVQRWLRLFITCKGQFLRRTWLAGGRLLWKIFREVQNNSWSWRT